jgi:sugar phosphate isomerase/epimerase
MPYRDGTVDWQGVSRGLHEINYKGLLNFEIPSETQCSLGERLKKLDYVRRLAHGLMDGDLGALA